MRTRTWAQFVVGLFACLFLVACGGSGTTPPQTANPNPRPQGSPDIVLLTVSGHNGGLSAILCTSGGNHSYLGDPDEAAEAIARTFSNLGFNGLVGNYADFFDGIDADGDGVIDDPEQRGFLQLVALMQDVYYSWIDGFDDPTRIVVVAHSHGAVWAHMAVSVMNHIPIDYLITLDGICFRWECEHQTEIADWLVASGNPYSWDISTPCARWPVTGQSGNFNTEDVVFSNVRINLEVQSNGLVTFDAIDNYRLDGTRTNIATYFPANEGHNDVRLDGSDALDWVDLQIRAVELIGP